MYKVIVVDDEHLVLRELHSYINWSKIGLEIVGEAKNGEEACTLVELLHPHIVITDMNMPGLNGLQFIEWLRKNGYATKVIVLSGYDDFKYTRPSFLLDAFDYLLKPLNETELIQSLIRAVEEIKHESGEKLNEITRHFLMNRAMGLMRDNFLSNVIHGVIRDENEMLIEADELKFIFPMSGLQAVVIKSYYIDNRIHQTFNGNWDLFYYSALNIINECLSEINVISFRNTKKTNEFVAIVSCQSKQHIEQVSLLVKRMEAALSKYSRTAICTGIGGRKNRISDISASYAEAVNSIESKAFSLVKYDGTDFDSKLESNRKSVHLKWKAWLENIRLFVEGSATFTSAYLINQIDELFVELELAALSIQELKKYLVNTLLLLERFNDETAGSCHQLIFQYKQHIEEMELQRVKSSLIQIISCLVDDLLGNAAQIRNSKEMIEHVKRYVQDNYSTASLDEISKRFFINKSYFCTLFKSVTGSHFSDYLTEIRMEKAKLMLGNGHLKTYEINKKVGYKDQRYFSQVFRKYTGVQPGTYRNNMKQG